MSEAPGTRTPLLARAKASWEKLADAWIALGAIAGLAVIGWLLWGNGVGGWWPAPSPPIDPMSGREAQGAQAPAPISQIRGNILADFSYQRGQIDLIEGGRSGSPVLQLDAEDVLRLQIVQRARYDRGYAEQAGLSREAIEQVNAKRRGSTLSIPEADVAQIRQLRDRTERDLALATAIAGARDEFMNRTADALSVLRETVPNPTSLPRP